MKGAGEWLSLAHAGALANPEKTAAAPAGAAPICGR